MCLVCSYKTLAGQSEVPYFDVVDAIWANADEYIVWLEITVDNVQAVERTESACPQIPTRKRNHIPMHVDQTLQYLTEKSPHLCLVLG